MHLCFIDESSTPPKQTASNPRPYFIIAGVIIPAAQWHGIAKEFKALLRLPEFNIQGEVKWRFFGPANSDADNPFTHLDQAKRYDFRARLFSIITKRSSIKIVACVSKVQAAYGKSYITDEEKLYQYTYKPISERFQYHLQEVTRTSGATACGIIVADHRGRKQDEALRDHHAGLMDGGGIFTSAYPNIIETIFLTPSHLSVGIQFADMVAGAIGRKFNANDSTCFDMIKGSFRRSPQGNIDGYGLVRFPKGWV
jgi:hypothetical protein